MLPSRKALFAGAIACSLASLTIAPLPSAFAQNADDRVSEDGTVALDGVKVPLPELMSKEGREYLRHLIVDKPFGLPAPDIAAERRRQDKIMFGFLAPMRQRYAVNIAEERIGGIVTDVVTPADGIAARNADRILINVHGGGFSTGARSASLVESVPLAAIMKIKVISIDYRMGPEHQFPAASEDVAAVYRELLKSHDASKIGIYGCSAGGMLTAQSVAWFQTHDLPAPGAIGVFCASLGGFGGGDSIALSGPLNGMLPPRDGSGAPQGPGGSGGPSYLGSARQDDPLAFPLSSKDVLADFPPTLFITGTRAFEFSAALNSHNKLTQAGGISQFHGWEGMFHGFFYNSEMPESREAYALMAEFFDKYLQR